MAKEHKGSIDLNVLCEYFIVLSLSFLIAEIFFKERKYAAFELVCFGALLVWRFLVKQKQRGVLPRSLLIVFAFYLASQFLGALMSPDIPAALKDLNRFVYVFIGGLLITAPLSRRNRTIVVVVLFGAAAVAGLIGILQHFSLLYMGGNFGGLPLAGTRPRGFVSHPILYAGMLAFVCASALILLLNRKNALMPSSAGEIFLLLVLAMTFSGILLSSSRGVWIALAVACSITLLLYDWRKAAALVVIGSALCGAIYVMNGEFRQRVDSIVTAAYTEDETGSAGNRLELWKGSLILFERHPLFGVGMGNYQKSIEALIMEGKIRDMPMKMHAHNLYLQALATQGLIGFAAVIGLFTVLLQWGMRRIRGENATGGYILILSTLLIMVGGMTEITLDINKYLAVYCLTVGLLGSYDSCELDNVHQDPLIKTSNEC